MLSWQNCKNLLCFRPDNLGDVLMTQPALRALKEQAPKRKITLFTSKSGSQITEFIREIDDVIAFDVPWIKSSSYLSISKVLEVVERIREQNFDGAVIFTNFSQNPLPTAMLAYLSDIPKRLGYCRENPYNLLTDWVLDAEPFLKPPVHIVIRQLDLVNHIGAKTSDDRLVLRIQEKSKNNLMGKLKEIKLNFTRPWLVVHPGASELKRRYSMRGFIEAINLIVKRLGFQVLLTGDLLEKELIEKIRDEVKINTFSLAGKLTLKELIMLIKNSPILISNNTGPAHIAAAVETPVIVLYALTNPEYAPWKAKSKVLFFDIDKNLRSKNQILNFTEPKYPTPLFSKFDIYNSVKELLRDGS